MYQPDQDIDAVQRPCARGERCRNATVWYDNHGDRHKDPALGPRAFCDRDRGEIATAVAWLPDRYLELHAQLGNKTPTDGPRVSGGGTGSTIPIRSDIDALMVQILNVTASWWERVAHVARLRGSIGIPERRAATAATATLYRMCTVLSAHLDALLALPPEPMLRHVNLQEAAAAADTGAVGLVHPNAGYADVIRHMDGAAAGLELLTLERRCRNMLGWTPQHQALQVPCWECDHRDLRRPDGGAGLEDRAECGSCPARYEGDRFVMLMAQVEQAARTRNSRRAS